MVNHDLDHDLDHVRFRNNINPNNILKYIKIQGFVYSSGLARRAWICCGAVHQPESVAKYVSWILMVDVAIWFIIWLMI